MSKIKLDLNSEQNILNMLMESSSISEDQMSKINANSGSIFFLILIIIKFGI